MTSPFLDVLVVRGLFLSSRAIPGRVHRRGIWAHKWDERHRCVSGYGSPGGERGREGGKGEEGGVQGSGPC